MFFIKLLKKKPGLTLLLIILLIISYSSIKPQFYIIGWDNYSSYFNIPVNIFRTLFATWRDYRGLGVPSDAETTDIFRQFFYFFIHPVVKEMLLDQLYMMFQFAFGAIAMYAFSYLLLKKYLKRALFKKYVDIGAFLSAFFYIYNLNTLSTFYFPMIMYVNRFLALPLIFLSIYILTTFRKISKKLFIFIIASFLFTSGSYITPTIFLTMVFALFIFGVFQENKKRFLFACLLYIFSQTFWFLPFVNYTIQKTDIIRLAPTFIDANETQLNRPKSFYDLTNQIILYPNFFDTKYTTLRGEDKIQFHPLALEMQKPFYLIVLNYFPFLFLLGSLIIILNCVNTFVLKNRVSKMFLFVNKRFQLSLIKRLYGLNKNILGEYNSLLWIPAMIFVFLFLSLKEFSPLGFLYAFFDNLTPYFSVLFRFGDTKFHTFIAFAGSISAAFGFLFIVNFLSNILSSYTQFISKLRQFRLKILEQSHWILIFVIVLPTIFVFRYYISGLFIGQFMYNKIPFSYFDIARIINSDSKPYRVLHLPMANEGYWKSYSWGMFGSSFLHFMLNKPLIDKTFEPASMENAYLDKRLENLLLNAQFLKTDEAKKERALEFSTLLKKTNVKYLIVDGTVDSSVYSKNMVLWGKFNAFDLEAMAGYLIQYDFAKEIKSYQINLLDYKNAYENWYPFSEEEEKILENNKYQTISLLEINNVGKRIEFSKESTFIDPKFKTLLTSSFDASHDASDFFLQSETANGYEIFPFKRQNVNIASSKNKFSLNFEKPQFSPWGTVFLPSVSGIPENKIINNIDVYGSQDTEKISFNFYLRKLPEIGNILFSQKLATLNMPLNTDLPFDKNLLRLQVDGSILPVPKNLTAKEQYIATVSVMGGNLPLKVLGFDKRTRADLKEFNPTQNPNCFGDALEDAGYSVSKEPFRIESQNQSTCLYYDLRPFLEETTTHMELWFHVKGESKNLDSDYHRKNLTSKPLLDQAVQSLEKPNLMSICVKEPHIDNCYNSYQLIRIPKDSTVAIPLEKPLDGATDMSISLTLKNTGYQKQKVGITNLDIDTYSTILETTVSFNPNEKVELPLQFSSDLPLTISFPKTTGSLAITFNPQKEGLYLSNGICNTDGYRTFRFLNNALLSYVENCYNHMFQRAAFSSDKFYFWAVDYNLLSGKFPKFILNDGFYSYLNEYLSIDQGYPDVSGFKYFQKPEMWYEGLFKNANTVLKELGKQTVKTAFTYIYPKKGLGDENQKEFTIHQDSENEGVLAVKSLVLQSLPTQWENLSINIGNNQEKFLTPKNYQFQQILPSLWKVNVELPKKGKYLLVFREGFDLQWKLFKSPQEMLMGFFRGEKPIKCEGFANCYVLENKDSLSLKQTLYIFYIPELLNGFGWMVTVGAVIVGAIILKRKIE